MKKQDKLDQYLEEYAKLLSDLARVAKERPHMLEERKKMMLLSASLIVSNNPEFVDEFRDTVKQAVDFIESCQSGELDPESFIIKDDDQPQ